MSFAGSPPDFTNVEGSIFKLENKILLAIGMKKSKEGLNKEYDKEEWKDIDRMGCCTGYNLKCSNLYKSGPLFATLEIHSIAILYCDKHANCRK